MSTRFLIKPSAYHDSVTLMETARELTQIPGVIDAAVVMATEANKSILREIGMVGAGVLRAPEQCFAEAFEAVRE